MERYCLSKDGEPPLPLWERVGVRGSGLSIVRNPSPGSHLSMRSDLSHKGRGDNEQAATIIRTSNRTLSGGSVGLGAARIFRDVLSGRVAKRPCLGNGSELPLPLRERVGVRGSGLSIVRNPSPGLHLTMQSDLSRKGRGGNECAAATRHHRRWIASSLRPRNDDRAPILQLVMPGLDPGIHVFADTSKKDVDGRDEPGHDENSAHASSLTPPNICAANPARRSARPTCRSTPPVRVRRCSDGRRCG